MQSTDKNAILQALRAQIEAELVTMTRIARDAAAGASHEENRAEGSKDMRSTEAAYIARGQADRVVELERARTRLASLELSALPKDGSIESTALVQLGHGGQSSWYFLLPVGGGRKVSHAGVTIHVITPTSPLGSALLGLSVEDEAEVPAAGTTKTYAVLTIV